MYCIVLGHCDIMLHCLRVSSSCSLGPKLFVTAEQNREAKSYIAYLMASENQRKRRIQSLSVLFKGHPAMTTFHPLPCKGPINALYIENQSLHM